MDTFQDRCISALKEAFPEWPASLGAREGEHAGQKWAFVRREDVVPALELLRDTQGADCLMDLTCVDWLNKGQPERFCMVYQLYSFQVHQYARVKAWVPEADPVIDSIHHVWKAAPWAEREVWDLFGVTFRGNPDLRRLVLPYDYEGHPLRKDYPLIGRGERQNFPRYVPR